MQPEVWSGYRKNTRSVAELWVQMFRYYTETFEFDEQVITIRQKNTLTRLEKLWNNHSIAIEDPFDLNHNLGGALTRKSEFSAANLTFFRLADPLPSLKEADGVGLSNLGC